MAAAKAAGCGPEALVASFPQSSLPDQAVWYPRSATKTGRSRSGRSTCSDDHQVLHHLGQCLVEALRRRDWPVAPSHPQPRPFPDPRRARPLRQVGIYGPSFILVISRPGREAADAGHQRVCASTSRWRNWVPQRSLAAPERKTGKLQRNMRLVSSAESRP